MTKKWAGNDPKYDNPPVSEVVCGAFFDPIKPFLTPYLGLLWEKYKPEFDHCEEVAPLLTTIETFDKSQKPTPNLSFLDVPPQPRIWFINEDKTRIIQVQRESFLYNWRRMTSGDDYPSYKNVIKCFKEHFSVFLGFIKEMEFSPITPLQYELTYVNHIAQGEGWDNLGNLGSLFPDFNFRWQPDNQRFLPPMEKLNWRTTFLLPDQVGRLHVSIQTGFRRKDDHPILILEMKARGFGDNFSDEKMWSWFDIAHNWIINGFADITDRDVQEKVWRRTQ